MVSGLRNSAKIEVIDPELKKSMDAALAKTGAAPGAVPGQCVRG